MYMETRFNCPKTKYPILKPHEKKTFTYTLSTMDEELLRKKQEVAIEKEKMVSEEMRLKAEKNGCVWKCYLKNKA